MPLTKAIPVSVLSNLRYKYGLTSLKDYPTCLKLYDKMGLQNTYKPGSTIVNLYSSNECLPITLQDYLKPSEQFIIEEQVRIKEYYTKYLEPVFKAKNANIKFVPSNPYLWESFLKLEKSSLKIDKQSDDHLHSNFLITCNYTSRFGEQLSVQHINCIGNRNWLEKYGRVRIIALCSPITAGKYLGQQKGKYVRTRMSIQAEAYSEVELVGLTEEGSKVFDKEFLSKSDHVVIPSKAVTGPPSSKGLAVLDIRPRKALDIDLDHFDYITKTLLVMSTPLKESINLLGFGADQFFMKEPEFLEFCDKPAKDLTVEEFKTLTKLFGYWPFKPEVLLSFEYSDELRRI